MAASAGETAPHLTACADPNNLPFSNEAQQGFENKIMALVARDLGMQLQWVWWAQRRGFVRNTLNQSKCDVWPGIASGVDVAATTDSYYRSTYVFVVRKSSHLRNLTLDDPRLHQLLVGVQMIGNDATNTPPAHAIAARGIVDNVRGYMIYGDYSRPNPPSDIVKAVAQKKIDVALAWGPMAGYFAHESKGAIEIVPVTPNADPRWPMTYSISMGVKRSNQELRNRINDSLRREHSAVETILLRYHVPLVPESAAGMPGS
jgi:mxaJ protein